MFNINQFFKVPRWHSGKKICLPMQETWVLALDQEDPLEKEMEPIPVLLPGESHRQRNLVGYSPWT